MERLFGLRPNCIRINYKSSWLDGIIAAFIRWVAVESQALHVASNAWDPIWLTPAKNTFDAFLIEKITEKKTRTYTHALDGHTICGWYFVWLLNQSGSIVCLLHSVDLISAHLSISLTTSRKHAPDDDKLNNARSSILNRLHAVLIFTRLFRLINSCTPNSVRIGARKIKR